MRKELQQIGEIEKYLLDNMSAQEKNAFEKKMKTDEPLAQQVAAQRRIIDRIKLRAFRQEMMALHPVMPTGSRFDWLKNKIYLNSMIAVFAVSLAVGAIYYTLVHTEKKEQAKAEAKPSQVPVLAVAAVNVEAMQDSLRSTQKIDRPGTKSIESLELPFETHTINANVDEAFEMKDSKSTVHFPANILVHQDGTPVKGKVTIQYREYRNSAQTAFSGIPMTYKEGGKAYNFNSAGMFEIRAWQNHEALKVKKGKSFTVDYNTTDQLDNCSFFVLNEEKARWFKKQPINFNRNQVVHNERGLGGGAHVVPNNSKPEKKYLWGILEGTVKDAATNEDIEGVKIRLFNRSNVEDKNTIVEYDSGYVIQRIKVGQYSAKISIRGYATLYVDRILIAENKISQLDLKLKALKPSKKKKGALQQAVAFFDRNKNQDKQTLVSASFEVRDTVCTIPKDFEDQLRKRQGLPTLAEEREQQAKRQAERQAKQQLLQENRQSIGVQEIDSVAASKIKSTQNQNRLLAEGADVGHTYPNLVKGLNCTGFGVYNCDQIYQVPNPISIRAAYTNEKGEAITDGSVLSMIDLQYNGAFSFDPSYFTCGKTGRNVLLLFTKSQKLYVLPEAAYKKMKITTGGSYTFAMKDISATVKTPEQLKKYLGLK